MSDKILREKQRAWHESPSDETAKRYLVEASRSDVHYAAWLRFIEGHWTLKPPTEEGIYERACRDVDDRAQPISPTVYVFRDDLGQLRAMKSASPLTPLRTPEETWKGYWWSEPKPELPRQSSLDKKRRIAALAASSAICVPDPSEAIRVTIVRRKG